MTQNFVTEICCGYRAVYLAVIAEWSACCASEYQNHIYIYVYVYVYIYIYIYIYIYLVNHNSS